MALVFVEPKSTTDRPVRTRAVFVALIQACLLGFAYTFTYELKKSKKVDLKIEIEDVVNILEPVEGFALIILTKKDWILYDIRNKGEDYMMLPHNIENLKNDHRASLFSHQSLFCFTKDAFYVFRFQNELEYYAFSYADAFPISYFPGVNQLGPEFAINDWNNTIILSTSETTLHVLDMRDLTAPKISPLHLHHSQGKVIMELTNHNLGKSVAVRYKDPKTNKDSVEIAVLRDNNIAAIDSNYISPQNYGILKMEFDTNSNSLILLLSNGSVSMMDCSTNSISVLDVRLEEKPESYRLFESGMRHFLLMGQKALQYVDTEASPPSVRATIQLTDPDFTFLSSFFLSPYYVTWDPSDEDYYIFRPYSLVSNDPLFTHPTCKLTLQTSEPFVPCKHRDISFFSIGISLVVIGLLICIQTKLLRCCLKRQEKSRYQKKLDYLSDLDGTDHNYSLNVSVAPSV